MNKLLIMTLVLLAIPLAAADLTIPEVPMCMTQDWCASMSEAACAQEEGTWSTDPAEYGPACQVVCCTLPDGITATWALASTCADPELMDGEVRPGACGQQPAQCAEGQSNCMCGTIPVESGFFCCQGQVSPYACEDEEVPVAGAACGNGVIEESLGEQCEEGQLHMCATGLTNSCTATCMCLYDEEDYDAEDDFCSPLEECSQGQECVDTAPAPTCENGGPCVSAIAATSEATISWSFDTESCLEELDGFYVDIVREDAPNMGPPRMFIDDNFTRSATFEVEPETHYSIKVGAVYESGAVAWSQSTTWVSGVIECFTERRAYCAGQLQRITCDDQNRKVSPIENCRETIENGICMPTQEGAVCIPEVACDACDASYQSMAEYGSPGLLVSVQFDSGPEDFACHELAQPLNVQQQTVTFCNYAYTYSALKEYESCSSITHCSDYQDPESCGEPDPCNVLGTCTWNATTSVCNAEEDEYNHCDEEWDESLCIAQGCIYSRNQCRPHDTVSCRDYVDEQQCTNGVDFDLDPSDNTYRAQSDDEYGFGKCKWRPDLGPEGACIKDSDDDYGTPGGELETDSDFENPSTTLLIDSDAPFGSAISIPFRVSEESITYAELRSGACGPLTRPTTTVAVDQDEAVITFTREDRGTYCLQYYSKDLHNNMEFVKNRTIIVDPTQLRIVNVTQRVTPNQAINLSEVYLTWRATRNASCFGGLTDPEGNVRAQTSGYGDAFDLLIRDLADGAYTFDIECSTMRGLEANHTEHVILDIDSRLTRPIPAQGTYRAAPLVGIHTNNVSTCEYESPTGWKSLTQQSRIVQIDGAPYRLHTAIFTGTNSTLYDMDIRCTFEDGITVAAGDADKIVFAIDRQPPETAMRYSVLGLALNSTGGDVPVVAPRSLVNISCADPQITGRGRNWESGCSVVRFVVDGEETNATVNDGFVRGYAFTPGMEVRIGGRDALGNDEPLALYTGVDEDISGPERPEFSIP